MSDSRDTEHEAVPVAVLDTTAPPVNSDTADYLGLFINLDRSEQRRANIEAQIARFGLQQNYQRFPAADGNVLKLPNPRLQNSEMGCFTSHYLVLKANLGCPHHLHIIEDDVIFSALTGELVPDICQLLDGALSEYDIVCTDVFINSMDFRHYKKLYDAAVKRDEKGQITDIKFQVLDLRNKNFACTPSSVVNKKSIRKLHDLCEKFLWGGPTLPIDLFYRGLCDAGLIRIGCLFPFVTSLNLDQVTETTIGGRYDMMTPLALAVARATFFIDCD